MTKYGLFRYICYSWISSRRITTAGRVTMANLSNRSTLRLFKPPHFLFASQFNIRHLNETSLDLHLHEPVLSSGEKRAKGWNLGSSFNWLCAKRKFDFSETDILKIQKWIRNNIEC